MRFFHLTPGGGGTYASPLIRPCIQQRRERIGINDIVHNTVTIVIIYYTNIAT